MPGSPLSWSESLAQERWGRLGRFVGEDASSSQDRANCRGRLAEPAAETPWRLGATALGTLPGESAFQPVHFPAWRPVQVRVSVISRITQNAASSRELPLIAILSPIDKLLFSYFQTFRAQYPFNLRSLPVFYYCHALSQTPIPQGQMLFKSIPESQSP